MAFETYTGAFERAIAHLVTAFGESPDVCFGQSELHTALFLHLVQSDLLDVLYTTRDGRRTPLVHQHYPASPALDREMAGGAASSDCYDIVLMNPSYVRSFELDIVARHVSLRSTARQASQEQPVPLLAVANFLVFDHLSAANMDLIERRFYTLVHAERDALRAYLGIFLRQWELDDEAHHGCQVIESWARQQPYVSVCCAQSYRDRAGHVFAGRYLNDWYHEAPLLPMEFSLSHSAHPIATRLKGGPERLFPTLEQSF